MPRLTVIPNLGPTEQGYVLADGTADRAGSLIAVECRSSDGSTADRVRLTTRGYQVTSEGRPILDAEKQRITIPELVDEFPRGSNLYEAMQGEMMSFATRFEVAGVATPTPAAPVPLPSPAAIQTQRAEAATTLTPTTLDAGATPTQSTPAPAPGGV